MANESSTLVSPLSGEWPPLLGFVPYTSKERRGNYDTRSLLRQLQPGGLSWAHGSWLMANVLVWLVPCALLSHGKVGVEATLNIENGGELKMHVAPKSIK